MAQEAARARASLPLPRLAVTTAKPAYPADGGALDLLVRVGVDLPDYGVDRRPLALALVIDRSGSMSGEPLEAAKAAVCAAVEMLLPDDWVSVVTYDDQVRVVAPLAPAGTDRRRLLRTVREIVPGGSTALYAGWAEGLSQAMSCPVAEVGARVVLLSDGMANVGPRDAPSIAADVAQAAAHGVTTTAMGFGRSYDEALLRAMADAGQGEYVFIEGEAQVVEAFQHELAGLSALRGRNVRLLPSAGFGLDGVVPGRLPSREGGVLLPDLVGGLERETVLTATFAPGAAEPRLTLVWDDLLTGAEGRLEVPLGAPAAAREEFERLPVDETVATQAALARIAEEKLRLAEAFRSGRADEATGLLNRLEQDVRRLPNSPLQAAEVAELGRLRELERRGDMAFGARTSEMQARDRLRGVTPAKRAAVFSLERALHARKVADRGRSGATGDAADRGATGPSAAPLTLARRVLTGPSGPVSVAVTLGDITEQAVDVLVNSTNRHMFGNAGVDGAVHRRGGPQLTRAARGLRGLGYGEAAFTPGFALPARYVVHAVAMPWSGGGRGELDVLRRAHASALALASRLGARTVAVPAIGTGSFGFPRDLAAGAAVAALDDALAGGAAFDEVRFVVLVPEVAEAFATALLARVDDRAAQPS